MLNGDLAMAITRSGDYHKEGGVYHLFIHQGAQAVCGWRYFAKIGRGGGCGLLGEGRRPANTCGGAFTGAKMEAPSRASDAIVGLT